LVVSFVSGGTQTLVGPPIGAEVDVMAASVIPAIDQHLANTGFAQAAYFSCAFFSPRMAARCAVPVA